jgi:hypothetical protein
MSNLVCDLRAMQNWKTTSVTTNNSVTAKPPRPSIDSSRRWRREMRRTGLIWYARVGQRSS